MPAFTRPAGADTSMPELPVAPFGKTDEFFENMREGGAS